MQKLDCFTIAYFNSENKRTELKISGNFFIPESQKIYFRRTKDQRTFELFLNYLLTSNKSSADNIHLSAIFLKREFDNLEDEEGEGMTANDYFENRNITKLETSEEGCTFEDWSAHLHGFMKFQRETCDLLNTIFKRFSEEYDFQNFMQKNSFSKFLKDYQI